MNTRLTEKCSHGAFHFGVCSLCACIHGSRVSLVPSEAHDTREKKESYSQALFAEALHRGVNVDQVWFGRCKDGTTYKWLSFDLPTFKMLLLATPGLYQSKYDIIRQAFIDHLIAMNKDPEIVKLFLLAGNDLPRVYYDNLMEFVFHCDRTSKIQRWVAQYNMRLIKPLLHLCRLAVRRQLRDNTVSGAAALHIAPSMRKFLNFSDALQEVPYTTVFD